MTQPHGLWLEAVVAWGSEAHNDASHLREDALRSPIAPLHES